MVDIVGKYTTEHYIPEELIRNVFNV